MILSITADKQGNNLWNQVFIDDKVYGFKNNDLWEGNIIKLYDKKYEMIYLDYRDEISYDVFRYELQPIIEEIVDITYVIENKMYDR